MFRFFVIAVSEYICKNCILDWYANGKISCKITTISILHHKNFQKSLFLYVSGKDSNTFRSIFKNSNSRLEFGKLRRKIQIQIQDHKDADSFWIKKILIQNFFFSKSDSSFSPAPLCK